MPPCKGRPKSFPPETVTGQTLHTEQAVASSQVQGGSGITGEAAWCQPGKTQPPANVPGEGWETFLGAHGLASAPAQSHPDLAEADAPCHAAFVAFISLFKLL